MLASEGDELASEAEEDDVQQDMERIAPIQPPFYIGVDLPEP